MARCTRHVPRTSANVSVCRTFLAPSIVRPSSWRLARRRRAEPLDSSTPATTTAHHRRRRRRYIVVTSEYRAHGLLRRLSHRRVHAVPLRGMRRPVHDCNARIRPEIFAISRANRRSLDPSQHLTMSLSAFFFTYALLCSARAVKCSRARPRNESRARPREFHQRLRRVHCASRNPVASVGRSIASHPHRALSTSGERASRVVTAREDDFGYEESISHLAQSRVVAHLASDVRRPRAPGRTSRPCARVARDAR